MHTALRGPSMQTGHLGGSGAGEDQIEARSHCHSLSPNCHMCHSIEYVGVS